MGALRSEEARYAGQGLASSRIDVFAAVTSHFLFQNIVLKLLHISYVLIHVLVGESITHTLTITACLPAF